MFEVLRPKPADKILKLMKAYREDTRSEKIDLGVGVYKNSTGITPIMQAVKKAEQRIWEEQQTKAYVGLEGDSAFNDSMIGLILNNTIERDRIAAVATPGGSGAVRQAFELIRQANPNVRVFVSNPTWPNHVSMLSYLGIEQIDYRYFDERSRGIDIQGMLDDISKARPGDVVLLHGCCHNPTGANLTSVEWDEVISMLQRTGATPMIDIAYQGFGEGVEQDAVATRKVAESCPETLIAASCSKNFGIYRERTGQLMLITQEKDKSSVKMKQETLAFLNRQNYSFPPDHGGRIVSTILNDSSLRVLWEAELERIRTSLLDIRNLLAATLQELSHSDRFGFITQHRGMFSQLGCNFEQVKVLRENYAIYMVDDSRINVAGLTEEKVPVVAKAIIKVGI
ncbi:MAG: aspartate/tyrosine/aromatic aminotransferase [Aestuariivita sp.]|nr:aspartate/tyrosine/aromatic aminotransferase [Aestuariivita sp.]